MKRKTFLLASAAVAMVLSACGNVSIQEKQLAIKNYKDSISTNSGGLDCTVKISMDYPEDGSPALVNNIREWLSDEVVASASTDFNDANALVKGFISQNLDEHKGTSKDLEDIETKVAFEHSIKINKIDENDKFVTFMSFEYIFEGGAHGFSGKTATTFRKSDGKIFGFNMLNPCKKIEIRELIEKHLMEYFDAKTTDQLHECLFLEDGETLVPLPGNDPYLYKDSIVFLYSQYEIAPYMAGMPEAHIPISEIKPYLSGVFSRIYFEKAE